ncbi:DoxX family protein [Poriferisphaera sp. WC338]|uniref:DoxX family protein n=1 Tax=Poriferisphaera sp. WC338 TaxID=3425129 RepID=UPI003D816476
MTGWVILIRIMVGCVFVSEGLQKYLFPEALGSGRFARIGIPSPEFSAYFTGSFEIVCGALVLIGWMTRGAVVPLMVIMLVAIGSTKIPMLVENGFWMAAHESRTDWAMLMSLLFMLVVGAGRWSIDGVMRLGK